MEGIKEIGAITFQINPMFRVLKKQQKNNKKIQQFMKNK